MDDAHRAYYEARAREYDDWWFGRGSFAARDRPGWEEEVAALERIVAELRPCRTLDAGCGTGFLTRRLQGYVVGVDQSPTMVAIAQRRLDRAIAVRGDVLDLPFADRAFERVISSHVYGHLQPDERERFLAEVRRVGDELVLIDSALRDGVEPEEWQERRLDDGSTHRVFKRFFTARGLAAELGGAETLFEGRWFVVVRA